MAKELTYAEAGVDRELRKVSKESLSSLEETYKFSKFGPILKLPYNNLTPGPGRRTYWDHVIEGVGTKVLLPQLLDKVLVAQLANKYDTIGIDGVAMAANDVIRSGAKVFTIADNIDAEKSDPELVAEWMKGLVAAAYEVEAPIVAGEIADVFELVKGIKEGRGHHIVVSCTGYVHKNQIIYGSNLIPGDPIIALRSSGVHSNGISLARKVLFKEWEGYYQDPFVKPDGFDKELIMEVLKPTRIYCKEILRVNEEFQLKAAVHVTGDAHLKFDKLMKFNPKVGLEFNELRPQPIFPLIQETARKLGRVITDEEMSKTYNLGDGFDAIVAKEKKDDALDLFEMMGVEAWCIGEVNNSRRITVNYNGKKILLK